MLPAVAAAVVLEIDMFCGSLKTKQGNRKWRAARRFQGRKSK